MCYQIHFRIRLSFQILQYGRNCNFSLINFLYHKHFSIFINPPHSFHKVVVTRRVHNTIRRLRAIVSVDLPHHKADCYMKLPPHHISHILTSSHPINLVIMKIRQSALSLKEMCYVYLFI